MKTLSIIGCLVFIPTFACAATLEWSRNTEVDMDRYNIFTCPTAGCLVQISPFVANTPRTAIAPTVKSLVFVAQTASGIKPSTTAVNVGVGAAAITAVDKTGNESGLSNQVSFPVVTDQIPPATPSGLTIR